MLQQQVLVGQQHELPGALRDEREAALLKPPSAAAVAWSARAMWLLIAWGY